ncbi:unnamed protein product [Gongylonema pulchrum]|uniref:DNA primase small subunit n=1 Tax=Gongylonema pulchrum TaxID=637853 RepID=A0A183EAC9_9BILA|nr:unnamed protein product [Gongylonema pulchrum]
MADFDESLLLQALPEYYRRHFPTKTLCKWLSYDKSPSAYFQLRELAFILENDVHVRFRSFSDCAEFERELRRANPRKLDIGAVYNHKPRDNKKFADFRAVERELVFDIDLTDYDEIRTCCTWLSIAVDVLDFLLKKHFGFRHRLWVFSGRRGIHCWVADAVARKLQNAGRSAAQQNIVKAATKNKFVHPMLKEVYNIIIRNPETGKLMFEQGWMNDGGLHSLLDGCTDSAIHNELIDIINELEP